MRHTPLRPRLSQAARDRRRRGSFLIFAAVCTLLLAFMGIGFVQQARLDRRASSQVDTRVQADDGSIVRLIGQILAEDVLGNQPEPYDYPWSDPTVTRMVDDIYDSDPAVTLTSEGGTGDDTWLASTEPDFSGGAGNEAWPHITNLLGYWLDLTAFAPRADGVDGPAQVDTTADANAATGDTGVRIGDLPADADGDGINDARWTLAPYPQSPDRFWVMATRIWDHGSAVNLADWNDSQTSPTTSGLNRFGSNVQSMPRWLWPGELNTELMYNVGYAFGGFVNGTLNPNHSRAFVDELTNYRDTGANQALNTFDRRYWHWLDSSRVYDDINGADDLGFWRDAGETPWGETIAARGAVDFRAFTVDDEIELRWRNGINKSSDNLSEDPAAPIETFTGNTAFSPVGTAEFMRQDNGEVASDYTGVTNPNYTGSIQDWFEREPRKQMTTVSGTSNTLFRSNLNGSAAVIKDVIDTDFTSTLLPAVLTRFGGAANYSDQLAASIVDFRDEDSVFTKENNAYGAEHVLAVSEAYVVGAYNASAPNPMDGSVTWTLSDTAAIIELVNPWNSEILVAGSTEVRVGEVVWGRLQDLIPDGTLGIIHETIDGEVHLIVPANQLIQLAWESDDAAGNLLDNITLGTDRVDLAPADGDWPNNPTPQGEVRITLNAPVEDDANGVDYQSFPTRSLPPTVLEPITRTDPAETTPIDGNETGFFQSSSIGTADGLLVLTMLPSDVAQGDLHTGDDTPFLNPNAGNFNEPDTPALAPQFGNYVKTGGFTDTTRIVGTANSTAGATPPVSAPGDEPFLIGNLGTILRSGDLLRMVFWAPRVDGGGTTLTFADVWQTSAVTQITDLMLDPLSTDLVGADDDALNHALYLVSRFNSIDTLDNNEPRRIPGMINVNTMPRRTLEAVLPIIGPDVTDPTYQLLINAITNGRANPSSLVGAGGVVDRGSTNRRGLAYVSELAGAWNSPPSAQWFIDFNEYEPDVGPQAFNAAGNADDNFTDNREERWMPITYLNQVATTRSDVYTAYVLVRSYNRTTGLPNADDEFRLIIVYDRSNLSEGGASFPRVLGVAKFDNN